MQPKFLFVSEPIGGIDIGAKRLVLNTLVRLSRRGHTIMMVFRARSFAHSRPHSHSITEIVDILPPDAPDADFGLAMSGIKPDTPREEREEA